MQPAKSWHEVLGLIQQSPLGQEVLRRFFSLYKAGKVSVLAYPLDLRAALLSVRLAGCPPGAAFVTDGEHGRIFYDPQGELGILAPFVFHEMVHSLDNRLWAAAGKVLSTHAKNDLLYASECMAFSLQHEFQEELKRIHPGLRSFHKNHYPKLDFLNREISHQEISALYGFNKK